ncbi:hypothetical protein [Amaricoccus sp. W119]|uniref:hypothetical protein n=1 Tax=Amaricoccus sp. W119 TaxID=3391833 RepID=UPI0039A7440C
MGYELVDQAIVRSWNNTPSNLAVLSDSDPINGAYVERRDRELPQTTQRVVLPPEAAFELVVRHGKLDNAPDTAAIRRGGLLDVAYTPNRPPKVVPKVEPGEQPRVIPSGFPVAITRTLDALDAEGVANRRQVALSPRGGDRGVPVFIPGGTNSTVRGENGFLPDPAIESYSIRARIRGSACFLQKDLAVPLYAGGRFPNALPLVVVVSRLGLSATDLRPAPPAMIGDIAQHAGVWRMKADGTLRPERAGSGTRVQRVNVGLYPGEDFDLEIACLPSPEVLRDTFGVIETMALQASAAASDTLLRNRLAAICTERVGAACKTSGKTQPLSGIDGAALPDMATLLSVAEQLLDAMKNKWPVEEIAAVTTLRACHAVTKPAPVRWKDPSAIKAFRRKDEYACNEILEPPKVDQEEAHDLLLDGQVAIDLSLVGGFQVLAETVGTDGLKLDDANRGRSMIFKRSGRWPTLIQKDGVRAYVSPDDVLGFKVAEDGSVKLPRGTITLLSVSNLPNHGAIGELIWPVDDGQGGCAIPPAKGLRDEVKAGRPPGAPVFAGTEGRLTSMELAPLFAAAATVQIAQRIAMPDGARDVVKETRTLKSERPQRFRDTLARRLSLRIVSVSRHAAAFETAPTYVHDARQMLFRRQPLRRSDQSILNTQTVEVWSRSTARPAVPDIRRPEPSFLFSRSADVSPLGLPVHKVTRRAMTRLYFGRGWFSSGEGERVALILWPPDYRQLTGPNVDRDQIAFGGRTMKLDNFQDSDLGAGGQFVTRWGGDPIRGDASPQSGFLIPPTAFGEFEKLGKGPHRPGFVPSARMPIPKTGQPKNGEAYKAEAQDYEFLTVSLITFEPCFDIDREEWYVDVELRPIRASEPFVRFGVARYQEQSINDGLMLSEPVSVTMQLLPLRDASVAETPPAKADERSFEVTVRGLGQIDVKDLKPMQLKDARERQAAWAENFDKLRTPKVKLAVFHEAGRDGDLRRTPISLTGLNKVDDSGLELAPVSTGHLSTAMEA